VSGVRTGEGRSGVEPEGASSRVRYLPVVRPGVSAAAWSFQCTALGQRELRPGRGVGRRLLDCGGVLGSRHAESWV
jgi:hypothetical protein